MIIKFDEHNKLNESLKNDLITNMLALTLFFSNIGKDNPKKYNIEYFHKYAKSMNLANNDQFVQEVIKDFKYRILTDPKILNKQEVYKVIDETPILYRKNDDVCNLSYKLAKMNSNLSPSSWCLTDKKNRSIIFLNKDATYVDVYHELSHAIEKVIVINPRIADLFIFKKDFEKQNKLMKMITQYDYSMTKDFDINYINYISDPSEIFARMNNFKIFLFKNKILKSPNEEITDILLIKLLSGHLYSSLNEKSKKEFVDSDFFNLLMFINYEKFHRINRYVDNLEKIKNIA